VEKETQSTQQPAQSSSEKELLDSWKAIAAYLNRSERTVRRWEGSEHLPVHRHLHRSRGSVYGYRSEIDAWWKDRAWLLEHAPEAEQLPSGASAISRKKWWIVSLAALLVLASFVSLELSRVVGPKTLAIHSLAVLPFTNLSGDPGQEYFADGMTEALTTELSKIRALKVVSRTSAMRYKNAGAKPVPQIAAELGVDAVVEGSAAYDGNEVRITVQLIHGSSDRHLWATTYERGLRGILALESETARAIAREVRVTVTPAEEARLLQARSVDPEAHKAYLLGLHHESKTNMDDGRKAYAYLRTAVQIDPNHAQAWDLLAHIYNYHPEWIEFSGKHVRAREEQARAKAEEAARRALAIDDSVIWAHIVLARLSIEREWNWRDGEAELRSAMEATPNAISTLMFAGEYFSALGRHQEALSSVLRAVELNPTNPAAYFKVSIVLHNARRFEESIKYAKLALEMEPTFEPAHEVLALTYAQLGRYSEAIKEFEPFIGGRPSPMLGYFYGRAGRRQDALRLLHEAEVKHLFGPFGRSLVHLGLGDYHQASLLLQQAYDQKLFPEFGWTLKVGSIWDPLRPDPGFQSLLRRMNLSG